MSYAIRSNLFATSPSRRGSRLALVSAVIAITCAGTGVASSQTQEALTLAQRQSVQASISAAIAAVNTQTLNATSRDAAFFEALRAVAQALAGQGGASIAFVATSAIAGGVAPGTAIHASFLGAVSGGAAPDSLCAAIITAALNAGVNAGAIGGGIGLAASAIENIDPTKARAVAALHAVARARFGTHSLPALFRRGAPEAWPRSPVPPT